MKKVININFQGRVIPIEETAYDLLQQYVDSLRRYFIDEEGRDEIINDIESRIAELMGETLKKGNICITDADVEAIILSIGRPQDFDGDEEKVKSKVYEQSGRSYTYTKGERLYRSENDKVISGVCSGIAALLWHGPLDCAHPVYHLCLWFWLWLYCVPGIVDSLAQQRFHRAGSCQKAPPARPRKQNCGRCVQWLRVLFWCKRLDTPRAFSHPVFFRSFSAGTTGVRWTSPTF